MQIEQVMVSLDGDNTVQAIQLRMRSSFQNQLQFAKLVVRNAQGLNPITVVDFTTGVPVSASGSRILVVSPNFAANCNPTAVPNFTMTNLIPASYFAAGRLSFEADGGTVYWSVSWGGAAYTGPQTGDFTNDSNGNFGPAIAGAFPTAGTSAYRFSGTATAASTTNAADYRTVTSNVTFTNNAGNSFVVVLPPPPRCVGDYNQDGGFDGADVEAFFVDWEAGQSDADVNEDGGVDGGDVEVFFTRWESGSC